MAGSRSYLFFWAAVSVVIAAKAVTTQGFSAAETPEVTKEVGTQASYDILPGVIAGDQEVKDVFSDLYTDQESPEKEEEEVEKLELDTLEEMEDEAQVVPQNQSSSEEFLNLPSLTRSSSDSFYDYAYWWAGTDKAKHAVCANPPARSKVKQRHIYDCCHFDAGWKLRQDVGKQVWDGVERRSLENRVLHSFVHDNHGSTEDSFTVSQEETLQETNSWTVSQGVNTHFGASLSLGFPTSFGLGIGFNVGVDISTSRETSRSTRTSKTLKIDQTFKVPPGRRLEIEWAFTRESVSMRWHADVYLNGGIGVYWDPDRRLFRNRNPALCGQYNYAIPVHKLADGYTWHQSRKALRFRRNGLFEGAHAHTFRLIHRECDVTKPNECKRTTSVKGVYRMAHDQNIRILSVDEIPVTKNDSPQNNVNVTLH